MDSIQTVFQVSGHNVDMQSVETCRDNLLHPVCYCYIYIIICMYIYIYIIMINYIYMRERDAFCAIDGQPDIA